MKFTILLACLFGSFSALATGLAGETKPISHRFKTPDRNPSSMAKSVYTCQSSLGRFTMSLGEQSTLTSESGATTSLYDYEGTAVSSSSGTFLTTAENLFPGKEVVVSLPNDITSLPHSFNAQFIELGKKKKMTKLACQMSSASSTAGAGSSGSPASSNGEEPCTTDGCVMGRNAEFKALVQYLNSNDDCMNASSYLKSITRIDGGFFHVTCGDSSTQRIFSATVKPKGSSGKYEVKFVQP